MPTKLGIMMLAVGFATVQAATIVAPNANTSTNGNADQFGIFGEGTEPVEFQWEFAASQLTSLVGDSITAIGFRLDAGAATQTGPISIGSFDLELSPGVNPVGSLSTTLANNIGAGGVTVYSGPLTLGTLTGGAGPNPFFLINFTTPFTYTGGDLLMTETVSNASSFAVDANTPDTVGDTAASFDGAAARAEFFNYPITEFVTGAASTTPEPASLLTVAGGMLLLGVGRFYVRRNRKA